MGRAKAWALAGAVILAGVSFGGAAEARRDDAMTGSWSRSPTPDGESKAMLFRDTPASFLIMQTPYGSKCAVSYTFTYTLSGSTLVMTLQHGYAAPASPSDRRKYSCMDPIAPPAIKTYTTTVTISGKTAQLNPSVLGVSSMTNVKNDGYFSVNDPLKAGNGYVQIW